MDVALDPGVNVENPVAPALLHNSSLMEHSQPRSPFSSQSILPPSPPYQFTTSSTHITSAPDRLTQSQSGEDATREPHPTAIASIPSPHSNPQSAPHRPQPLEEDHMDVTIDAPQPEPEESFSNTVLPESTDEHGTISSIPENMETEPTGSPDVANDSILAVGSSPPVSEPPITVTTDHNVARPTVTGAPSPDNDPQTELPSEQPSSQDFADSLPDDSQSNSQESPVSGEEEHAYWADVEEDTSSPDEEEMKEIESGDDYSALDYDYWEKTFYRELDDPEYKPAEKARLTWKFKGVRGTKEKPNRATIMRSPAALIGGLYWTIKFFPRGNNVNSLSIYIESSATPPTQDKDIPETEFRVFKGPPNAVLSDLVPEIDLTLPASADSSKAPTVSVSASQNDEKQELSSEDNGQPTPPEEPASEHPRKVSQSHPPRDWRVSAQIGVIIYNPNEPRTAWMQSSCHQFNSHNVDWGWTTFHGPWDQIHQRHRGQRQALLRNDTLAFDAYLRIIDDPTQSLWWHSSDSEPIWDSLNLTGYRPMGDSILKYSFEVAGLVSWLLLAPFREIIQDVNILEHLTTPGVKPRPLCEALQKLLLALRTPHPPQLSVDTDFVTQTLRNLQEFSRDVMEFWERFRRSLELELEGTDAVAELAKIFDGQMVNCGNTITDPVPDKPLDTVNYFRGDFNSKISVPAQTSENVESGVKKYLSDKPGKWSLPAVLHVELARQKFDKPSRNWKLISRRVGIDEELDLSDFVADPRSGKYSLYGFVVHKGKRTSGQFYSILRPAGPGSRWLAFEDAGDNKIECLTRKAAINAHEGIPPEDVRARDRSGHDIAVVVMYVRNDVLPRFLTREIEPWDIPGTRKAYLELGHVPFASAPPVTVEAYSLSDLSLVSNSLFDAYDLMETARAVGQIRYLTLPASTSIAELREKFARWQSNGDIQVKSKDIRLWKIGRPKSGFPPTSQLTTLPDLSQSLVCSEMNSLRLWMHILTEDDAKLFAVFNPQLPANVFENEHSSEAAAEVVSGPSSLASQIPLEEQSIRETQNTGMADLNSPADPTDREGSTSINLAPSNPQPEVVQVANETETPDHANMLPSNNNDNARQDSNIPISVVQITDAEPSTGGINILAVATADPASQSTTSEQPGDSHGGNEAGSADHATPSAEDISTAALTQEDSVMGDTAPEHQTVIASNENSEAIALTENAENDINEIAQLPFEDLTHQLVPLPAQVYYFVQIFDIEKQEFRVAGVFFSKRSSSIKASVRAALGWPDDKLFHLWHRVDGISILSISSNDRFNKIVSADRDGECFLVGEVLPKSQSTEISERGSFANPDLLAQYLWALSRRHPTQSLTGTKIVDATYNGEYYSGDFKKGYYHGKGTHISDSGATYTGDFVLGQRHGKGVMEFASGDTYDGDWFEDERNGQGTFVERKTGNKYVGGYRAGKRHGKGISYWEVADEEMDLCQICYSQDQDALFYSCGHVCACVSCAKQVDICPMCRKKVANVVKIYRS
ncbi:MATH and UCH domain-containing protein [Histoplasma ohiense]|nr:MATH and UCH domain-containing protein [Histoplasma ohiense (nom. inval.)]